MLFRESSFALVIFYGKNKENMKVFTLYYHETFKLELSFLLCLFKKRGASHARKNALSISKYTQKITYLVILFVERKYFGPCWSTGYIYWTDEGNM